MDASRAWSGQQSYQTTHGFEFKSTESETEGSTHVDVDILVACVGESEGDELVGSIQDLGFVDVCEGAFPSDTARGVTYRYAYRSGMRSKSSNWFRMCGQSIEDS